MKRLLERIREILRNRHNRRAWARIISAIACLVVFFSTYALILPAITMEKNAYCGIEAHQHDDSCYSEELICTIPESEGHTHDDSCYTTHDELSCQLEEHVHGEGCYDEEGNLICELIEHEHDSSCWQEVTELTCGLEESEGHHHTDACYEKILICGKEAHTHGEACYEPHGEAAGTAATNAQGVMIGGTTVDADVSTDEVTDPAAAGLTTGAAADPDAYVPTLDELDFNRILNRNTGIYYYPVDTAGEAVENQEEEGQAVVRPEEINSADIPADAWQKVNKKTVLGENDILRVYFSYTIPAGSLNETNDIARYRLPANLHISDDQIEAINKTENGIAAAFIDYDTLAITDADAYHKYLGVEAVEGTRRPGEIPAEDAQEYISAVVRVENVYDTEGLYGKKDALLGQDLVFTFVPYTVQTNQNTYDAQGDPTSAGETVKGWFTMDLTIDQIDFQPTSSADSSSDSLDLTSGTREAEIVFVEKYEDPAQGIEIDENSTKLVLKDMSGQDIQEQDDSAEDADNPENAENPEQAENVDDADNSEPVGEAADESDKEASAEGDADEANYPAQSFKDSITVRMGSLSTDTNVANAMNASNAENTSTAGEGTASAAAPDIQNRTELTVSVEAEEGTFPEGTTMHLAPVTGSDLDTVAEAVEGAVESRTAGFHAVDITFRDVDGNEIEPRKPIKVSMQSESIRQAVENPSTAPVVVHVEDNKKENEKGNLAGNENVNGDGSEADREDEITAETDSSSSSSSNIGLDSAIVTGTTVPGSADADNLTFEADSFSVYAIVYTVDFHWNVDGKEYDFSFPGGGFISFKQLVEVLGIVSGSKDEAAEEGEATSDKFVENVEQITFSTPDLLSVSKVEKYTTVGAIKESLGLECEYSAELTEEQIEEINAQDVEAGDWALISLKPFLTQELLTVTMKSGDVFTINVTDAQDPYGLDGQSFEMIVNGNKALSPVSETEPIGGVNYQFLNNADPQSGSNLAWQFEYDHEAFGEDGGGYYISHAGQYLKIVGDNNSDPNRTVTLVNSKAEATPVAVKYDKSKGKYSFSNKADSSSGFLRQFNDDYFGVDGNSNDDNAWFELRDPVHPGKPALVSPWDVKGDNIRIKLFDYTGTVNNGDIDKSAGDYHNASTWHSGTGINNGRTLIFSGGGLVSQSDGQWNYYTGQQPAVMQGIVKNRLSGGYPELTNTIGTKGASLGYLFGAGGQDGVTTYAGSDGTGLKGLLRRDENGYYYYSSEQNFATLVDPETGQIVNDEIHIYSESYKKDKPSVNAQKIGFFPFDPYRAGETKAGEEKGFNGSPYNHQFGMTLEADFALPPNGKLPNGEEMTFSFSGDDDVWVFIDDVLVLDLGGVHQPLSGKINFAEGKSYVTDASIQTVPGQTNTVGSGKTLKELFEAAGKKYDDSSYSIHKIKFFYLERGGCDSNCTLSFNLDVVKGKGSVDVAKYDIDSQPVAPLKGVKFGLYSDPECTVLMKEITSDGDGIVSFTDLPVKTDDQEYYLKETKELAGYQKDENIYTLRAVKQSTGKYNFIVMKDGVEIDTIGQDPQYPVIYNEQIEPISLKVEKKWQNQNGEAIAPPVDGSASFKVQRYFRKEGDVVVEDPTEPVTLRVFRYRDGQTPVQEGSDYTLKGGTKFKVNWGYSNGYLNYNYNDRHNTYRYNSTSGNYSVKSGDGPMELTLPDSGTANLYLRDENVNSGYGAGVINVVVTDTTPYEQTSITTHVSTDWAPDDTGFNNLDSCPTLTLPENDADPWIGTFSDLKLAETKADGLSYFYKYYIIETGKTPSDAEIVYVDGNGDVVQNPSTLQTDVDGSTQTIINRIQTGKLQIKKEVQYNGNTPPADKKSLFEGDYTFTVYQDQLCANPYPDAENPMTFTIHIGKDGAAKTSETKELPAGTYWIKENVAEDAQIVPLGSNPQEVTVPASTGSAAAAKIHTVTNNLIVSEGDDNMTLDIEKKFTGINSVSDIPDDFQIVVTYELNGKPKTITLKCESSHTTDDGLRINISHPNDDPLSWKWHVYSINEDAKNVKIKEVNYGKSGYEHSATYNGTEITDPDKPETERTVPITAEAAVLTRTEGRTTSQTNMAHYILSDDYIVLIAITGNMHGTVVVSKRSLNMAERDAVTKGIPNIQNGPFTNDHMWFYSEEEHFIEGHDVTVTPVHNRDFIFKTLGGEHIIVCPPSSNKQAIAYTVSYGGESSITNSVYTNNYTEQSVDLNVVKIAKGNSEKTLPGAKFTATLLDEEQTTACRVVPKMKTDGGQSELQFSTEYGPTDDEGKVTITGLKSGYYMIEESLTPEGYVKSTEDPTFYIHVHDGEITYLVRSTDASHADDKLPAWDSTKTASGLVTFDKSTNTATVENEPGAALPNTGGPGTRIFSIFGSIMILGAGVLLWRRRRTI